MVCCLKKGFCKIIVHKSDEFKQLIFELIDAGEKQKIRLRIGKNN